MVKRLEKELKMKRFAWCLCAAALMAPVLYGCSSELSEEEEKQSIQDMKEEGEKMEELLPAKID